MPKDLYLGPTTIATVRLADGSYADVPKGGKLPGALADGELDRIRNAGTPLVDAEPSAAAAAPPGPSLDEDFDEPERREGNVALRTASGQVVYTPGTVEGTGVTPAAEEPEPRRSRSAKG